MSDRFNLITPTKKEGEKKKKSKTGSNAQQTAHHKAL